MNEDWGVARSKAQKVEYLCKERSWSADKKDAERMHEEFAKGTVNCLKISETAKKELDPYLYDTIYLGALP
jgi:hypothetical protein